MYYVHWCWSGDSHCPRCRLATTIFKQVVRLPPIIRRQIWDGPAKMKSAGQFIIVVDKNITALAPLAAHYVVLEKGQVVWLGGSAALRAGKDLTARYLGV